MVDLQGTDRFPETINSEDGQQLQPAAVLLLYQDKFMKHTRKAYTLTEIIIVSVIITAMATIAVPRFNLAAVHKQTADRTAKRIVTDLRQARMMAIIDAANNSKGYQLRLYGNPYDSYSIKNRDTNEKIVEYDFDPTVSVTASGNKFSFGPLGDALEGETELTVSSSGRSFTITVTRTTGMIKCVEN